MKQQYIKICPNCGSTKIDGAPKILSLIGVPLPYRCISCSFEGHLFPEIELDKLEKFQKDIKKQK